MSALDVDDVMKGVCGLPALPMVVHELLSRVDHDELDVAELARKIALDPGLTARSLRLANSSFYGMANHVNTMQEAISILGLRTIRSVVTTAALLGAFETGVGSRFNVNAFWRHAIATGLCARELAPRCKLDADHAYTTGLLHDVGRLVLVTRFSSEYEVAMAYRADHDCSLLDAERAVLLVDHAEVGRLLTQHWRFPEAMQQAVACHHQVNLKPMTPMVTVLIAANTIVHALDLSQEEDDCVPKVPASFWEQLGVGDDDLMTIFARVEEQFAGASTILNT